MFDFSTSVVGKCTVFVFNALSLYALGLSSKSLSGYDLARKAVSGRDPNLYFLIFSELGSFERVGAFFKPHRDRLPGLTIIQADLNRV